MYVCFIAIQLYKILADMKTYIENEILESMLSKIDDNTYKVGRRVNILIGENKGIEGVIQCVDHSKNNPLQKNKIRVWLNGYSCVDAFDFEKHEIELIDYVYISGLGYY